MYVCLIMLFNIPFIQRQIGSWTADALSEQLNTNVSIGNIQIGLPNRIIIDDLCIDDQQGNQAIKADRLAATVDILPLSRGKISISSTQLFGLTAIINRPTPDQPTNCQFLLDAFKSDTTDTKKSNIDLRLGSLIVRRGHIAYDVMSEPATTTLTPNHLDIKDIDLTLSLKALNADSIDLTIKRLNAIESHSNLSLHKLQAHINANNSYALLTKLETQVMQSELKFDTLEIHYPDYEKDHTFAFRTSQVQATLLASDIKPFTTKEINFDSPIHIEAIIDGTDNRINTTPLHIYTDNENIRADIQATLLDWQESHPDISADIMISIDDEGKQQCMNLADIDTQTSDIIMRLGQLDYTGKVDITSQQQSTSGILTTGAGTIDIDITNYSDINRLDATINTEELNLEQITSNPDFGTTAIMLQADVNTDSKKTAASIINATLSSFNYKGNQYDHITADLQHQNNMVTGEATVSDDALAVNIAGSYDKHSTNFDGTLDIRGLNPHALNLTDKFPGDVVDVNLHANTHGTNIDNITGLLDIDQLTITTPEQTLALSNTQLKIVEADGMKQLDFSSEFADAHIEGDLHIETIADAFVAQLSQHLPAITGHSAPNTNKFNFTAQIRESDILHHYINYDYIPTSPINISGHIDAPSSTMLIDIDAPSISHNDKQYTGTHISVNNNVDMLSLSASSNQSDEDNINTRLLFTADAHDNQLQTLLNWDETTTNKSNGMIYATTAFTDSLGKIKADIDLHKSQITINDTLWQVQPSTVSIFDKQIDCNNIKISNDNHYIVLNGTISDNPTDSLVVSLNDLEVAYITELIDFHAVRFKGQASGQAVISNVYDDIHLGADITIHGMHLQEGRLGTGHIRAAWDNDIEGIRINGHIVDNYKQLDRTTDIDGFVSPSRNDLDLEISTNNTNAEFLNGFLSSTFSNISGNTNGVIHIIGPLNDVNLVGNISADVDMTLRATNVTYHVNPQDSIHLRKYGFDFINTRLSNRKSGTAVVNGTLAHQNMKNFKYDFDISMDNLTIYDEHEFNSDKFYATVFADGTLGIHGSDGHPLRMTANVTPTRGSVFAYDAATPDVITSGNFVTFRDVTPIATKNGDATPDSTSTSTQNNTTADTPTNNEYQGDIFMDISLHVNPDCEIKLRMDNVEDGYMTTYGSGTLLAHYHNKSPFSLNGIYQIHGGRYKLYLQDIIYRDLDLQDGSNVVFNGSPFDANIHLICHHTIPSVPLRDLTSANTFSQNSKVKVICVMDITGKLDNMNFAFDLQLPNVSDETRQLVKSLITSEEEMNMQMIYLLGLQRFYTNEYARANGESGSNQAVNTLLSSTLSGQINQMLSSVIGTNSKWNFGTGITTGEQGWNDLDVEGNLSGSLLNDRLLINGNFGYRDNALTNSSNFIGDFDVRWRLSETGNTYIKAYNQTNDRYFTKATLNTQGIGITYQRNFDSWKALFRRKMKEEAEKKKK